MNHSLKELSKYVLKILNSSSRYVVLGVYNISKASIRREVEEATTHPSYSDDTYENDIALFRLKDEVVFNGAY